MGRVASLVGLPVRDNLPDNGAVMIAGDVARALGVDLRTHYMDKAERARNIDVIKNGGQQCGVI